MSACRFRFLLSQWTRRPQICAPKSSWILPARATYASASTEKLNFQAIDKKWQQRWEAARKNAPENVDLGRKSTYYVLPMFPYPSGSLHMGHLRVYTISDVLARHARMCGRSIIHPMGWDAFGLPAENAAIERGVDPAEWTAHNIAAMRRQLDAMGGAWDWDRELAACDPAFYKHTQRIFLMLHESGLAYRAESVVNYDPVDKTVLANEQVDAQGRSWRSGAKVERVRLRQWFLRIKDFQEELLQDLDILAKDGNWPERVLAMQRNWLGKSEGVKVQFRLENEEGAEVSKPLEVFTTRLDTLFGVQYIALSLQHSLVQEAAKKSPKLQEFIDSATKLPPDSKAGFLLPGVQAINPASYLAGITTKVQQPVPVFAAPYVLEDYGSGAVMGVPGHDARDHAFWRQNKGSEPILVVVKPVSLKSPISAHLLPGDGNEAFLDKGVLTVASGPFSGLSSDDAILAITTKLQEDGHFAEPSENWRLRDWLISRQRYWGTPIPMVHCSSCGTVPVPESDLPVLLPTLEHGQLEGKGGNPLANISAWLNVPCPSCGSPAKRETDTMDTFMDSSWYFFRFADPKNDEAPISAAAADASLPVDIYVGGIEHAILHLLYARFISKFLTKTPLWPSGGGSDNRGEPFRRLVSQGMVHGRTFSDPATGRFLRPEELDFSVSLTEPTIKSSGQPPMVSFEKMSKSKHNGVDPLETIARFGADATRAHMLFAAPVADVLEWREDRIIGIQRWFQKLSRLSTPTPSEAPALATSAVSDPATLHLRLQADTAAAHLWLLTNRTARSVSNALSRTLTLNTAVSDLIKLTNALTAFPVPSGVDSGVDVEVRYHATATLLRLLAPIAPAFASECWECLHAPLRQQPAPVLEQSYPEAYDEAIAQLEAGGLQDCAVQIDGKVKFAIQVEVPPEEMVAEKGGERLKAWILEKVLETEDGEKWFGKAAGRVDLDEGLKGVYVVKGGKTVNFVLNEKGRERIKKKPKH